MQYINLPIIKNFNTLKASEQRTEALEAQRSVREVRHKNNFHFESDSSSSEDHYNLFK